MLEFRKFNKDDDLDNVLELELRDIDRREAWASLGKDSRGAVLYSLDCSQHVWVITYKGNICGLFGLCISEFDGKVIGVPWLVANDIPFLGVNRLTFLRQSKKVVEQMLEIAPVLINVISVFNKDGVAWLSWLGFEVDPDKFAFQRDPNFYFRKFRKERPCAFPQ